LSQVPYDLVIRGGTVATTSDAFEADVAVRGESIVAVGQGLGPGTREIDARGKLVLPGGIDSHCHIEQLSAAGLMNADTFETATRAALFGGTTSVISFAAQHVGMNLADVVTDYAALARKALENVAFTAVVELFPTETALLRLNLESLVSLQDMERRRDEVLALVRAVQFRP